MLISLWILLGLLLALHAYREYWHRRDLPQIYTGEFEGELMKAGTTYIARRPARNDSQRTIVCFPGFLHDMRYFQEVYKEHDAFYHQTSEAPVIFTHPLSGKISSQTFKGL